jgi:hypothetical protein
MNAGAHIFAVAMVLLGGAILLLIGVNGAIDAKVVGSPAIRTLYLLIGAAALYLAFQRDFYLPFLGPAAMPCSGLLPDRTPPGATRIVRVPVAPGAKVLYWAAEPAMEGVAATKDWRAAYAAFENVGVTTAGADGIAYLKVRAPQAYTVPALGGLWKKTISPHVHYRICGTDGIIGRVETMRF